MKKKRTLATLALSALLASSAHAAVNFTVDLTITSADGSAFSIGENVSVTLTTIDGLGAPNKQNDGGGVDWDYTQPGADPGVPLFSNISITGTSGAFDFNFVEKHSNIRAGDSVGVSGTQDRFFLYLDEAQANGFNLFRNGEELNYFDFRVDPASLVSVVYASNPGATPENTFVNGTYEFTDATVNAVYFYTDGYSNEYIGTATALTVTGAVPEPAATPIITALAALAYACQRRRR